MKFNLDCIDEIKSEIKLLEPKIKKIIKEEVFEKELQKTEILA